MYKKARYISSLITVISLTMLGVLGQPVANFTVSKQKDCSPLIVNFSDNSSGKITKWFWDFGNGNTSTLKNPTAIYIYPGTYNISLAVEDETGQKDTLLRTNYLEVFQNPVSDFDIDTNRACPGIPIHFINKSLKGTGEITKTLWDLGGGTFSNTNQPTHPYLKGGVYDITLMIVDENGCESIKRVRNLVKINFPPIPNFTSDRQIGCGNPLQIKFKYTGTSNIINYHWDFGEENYSIDKNPISFFHNKGSFDVILKVIDGEGCADSISKKEYIHNKILEADFNASEMKACFNQPLTFQSQVNHNFNFIVYQWDFGNGSSSNQINPSAIFQTEGDYTIKLITRDPNSLCIDTVQRVVKVNLYPVNSSFPIIDLSRICDRPSDVSFSPSSEMYSTFWRFSKFPSDTSRLQNLKRFYPSPGEYDIEYVFIDSNGCRSEGIIEKQIIVENPSLGISGDSSGCIPKTVSYTSSYQNSKFPIISYQWYINNKLVSTSPSFNHTFDTIGKGVIKLVVENSRGCAFQRSMNYSFGAKLNPDFEFIGDTLFCKGEMFTVRNLTDTSEYKMTGTNWSFDPPDFKSPSWRKSFTAKKLGYNDATLKVYNYTCESSISKNKVFKVMGPVASIFMQNDPCTGITKLTNKSQDYTKLKWIINNGGVETIDSISNELEFDMSKTFHSLSVKMWVTNETNRCIDDSDSQDIAPFAKFKASFTHSEITCSKTSVHFINNSVGGISERFLWYVDGKPIKYYDHIDSFYEIYSEESINYQQGSFQSFIPKVHFVNPGDHKVRLIGLKAGCPDTFEQIIRIPGPEAEVELVQLEHCLPAKVLLKLHNYDPGKHNATFSMGNGSEINVSQKQHEFIYYNGSETGKFDVFFDLKDNRGCSVKKKFVLNIAGPTIDFNHKQQPTCEGAILDFEAKVNDYRSFLNYTYKWQQSSQILSTANSFSTEFNTAGDYAVQLFVKDPSGCEATKQKTVTVSKGTIGIKFKADTTFASCPPLRVAFTPEITLEGNISIKSYQWSFGDNTVSNLSHPQKIYTFPGAYDVSLIVTDIFDCKYNYEIKDLILIEGPNGEYNFTPERGCLPLEVNFTASSNNSSNSFFWDLGNGSVSDKSNFKKVYERAGNFTPLLILTDAKDCKVSLPPIKTVQVFNNPIANFVSSNSCFNSPTLFYNNSNGNGAVISKSNWHVEDTNYTQLNFTHQFKTPGVKEVKLITTNQRGCEDTIIKHIKIYGFDPDIFAFNKNICLGDEVHLVSLSKSDTTLISTEWIIDNNISYFGKYVAFKPEKKGWFNVKLRLQNSLNCDTVFETRNLVMVGDTLAPIPNNMLHVSVVDDNSLQIKYKKSQEPDFDKYHIYKLSEEGEYIKSLETNQLNDTLVTIRGHNTLHSVYCYTVVQENTCGFVAHPSEGDIHCSVELSGKSDTNAAILHWNHYSGWNQIDKYIIYKENLGNFDSIGEVLGNVNTYIDSLACFTDLFSYRVLAIEKSGNVEQSWSDTCKVKPIYHNIVPPPYMLYVSVPDNKNTDMEWVQLEVGKNPIHYYEIHRSLKNFNYTAVDTLHLLNASYYVDSLKKDVLKHNYHYKIKAVDLCEDKSEFSNLSKTILLKSELTPELKPKLTWTKYKIWEEEVAYYVIEQLLNNGEFIEIGRSLGADDTSFIHENVPLNCFEQYAYRVTAYRKPKNSESLIDYDKIISISNHTTPPIISKLYAPNAFSPNTDGLNDVLEVKGAYIKEFNIKVFNRWGEKLYESDECFATWDATFMGQPVPEGVYVYIVQATGADGVRHSVKQDVTLLR